MAQRFTRRPVCFTAEHTYELCGSKFHALGQALCHRWYRADEQSVAVLTASKSGAGINCFSSWAGRKKDPGNRPWFYSLAVQ